MHVFLFLKTMWPEKYDVNVEFSLKLTLNKGLTAKKQKITILNGKGVMT